MNLWQLNVSSFRAINDLGKHIPILNPIFVFFAQYVLYFIPIILLMFWFSKERKNKVMVLCASFSFVLAEILGKLAGKFHYNIEPFAALSNVNKLIDKPVDNSFPSDHSLFFFSICFTFFLFKKRNRVMWLVLALFVAISRVGVGVHYPLDIIVGSLIGIISSSIVFYFLKESSIIEYLISLYEKIVNKLIPSTKTNH